MKLIIPGTMKDAQKKNIFYVCSISIGGLETTKAELTWLRPGLNMSILRKSRCEFDKERTSRFVNAKYKNAKLYSTNVSLSSFEQYFKAVNNPSDPFIHLTRMLFILTKVMKIMNLL